MARFREIYYPGSAFGGHSFRATSNGETVHLQHRGPNANRFKTVRRITVAQWRALHDEHEHILSDPAWIAHAAMQDMYDY